MKLAFVITPSRVDLLHDGQAETLRGAALDLTLDGLRVDRLAHVLPCRSRQPASAELDVHLGDDAPGRASEGNVRALTRRLARRRVERARRVVPVDPLDVDLAASVSLLLLERGAACELDGTCRHPGHA